VYISRRTFNEPGLKERRRGLIHTKLKIMMTINYTLFPVSRQLYIFL
jgi:hypothetical protein